MVYICAVVCTVCGIDFYFGKGWNCGSELESCDCYQDSSCCGDGVGYGFFDKCAERYHTIGRKSWIFLILSGIATGASWLCYYRALQLGQVSKVVPIDKLSVVITLVLGFVFLHEQFSAKSLIGCILIGAGTLVMVL